MHTSQAPIGSGFGPATAAHDIVEHCDLSGKVAIVTGGYAGMGLEITKALICAGVHEGCGGGDARLDGSGIG